MKTNPPVDILTEDERPTLASRLIAARHARGLSQSGLALASGLSKSAIQSLEQGRRTEPTYRTLIALCTALDVTMDSLMGAEH